MIIGSFKFGVWGSHKHTVFYLAHQTEASQDENSPAAVPGIKPGTFSLPKTGALSTE